MSPPHLVTLILSPFLGTAIANVHADNTALSIYAMVPICAEKQGVCA